MTEASNDIEVTPIAWCIREGKKQLVLSNGFTMALESDDATERVIKKLEKGAKKYGHEFPKMDYEDYYGWGYLKELKRFSEEKQNQ